MPLDDTDPRVSISILTLFSDVKGQITDMRTSTTAQISELKRDLSASIVALSEQVGQSTGVLSNRLDHVEDWRIGHEKGDGHPALSAAVRENSKTLDNLANAITKMETRFEEGQRRLLAGIGLTTVFLLALQAALAFLVLVVK